MADSSKHVQVTFAINDVDERLHVVGFDGEEGLSSIFEFNLVLASESDRLDIAKIVGRAAVLMIDRDGVQRHVHGTVSTFRQLGQSGRFTTYEAYLVPRIWRLLHFQDSRTFQEKTVEQVVASVLEDAGIDTDQFKIALDQNKPTPSMEYSVQYRESHWAYVARLLEEMGFYYFFQHKEEGHKLLMANFYQFHPPIAGEVKVPFHAPSPSMPAGEHIFHFTYRESVRPDKVTLGDYNPLKPSLDLKTDVKKKKTGEHEKTMEVYDYPAEYSVPEKGAKKAKMRLEVLQASARLGEGQSDCARLVPGYYFTLTDHFSKDLTDKDYLLTLVRHTFEKHGDLEAGAASTHGRYSNTFQCIPRKTPFRPQHSTPRPTANGIQTAIVVGPWGEEIHTDQFGRVKVQFHWDRHGQFNEKSSCWVPVVQMWAGQGWGAAFIPRIGDEVIVDFIEGDPDRPVVTGRVYHAQNVPPLMLPADKTKSTIMSNSTPGGGGFNELRFEDKKGAEQVHLHAQKDLDVMVRDNITVGAQGSVTTGAGGNSTLSVGKNRNVTAKEAHNTVVGGDLTETIKGNKMVTLACNLDQAIGENRSEIIEGLRETAIKGDDTLQVTGKVELSSLSEMTLAVGASTVVLTPAGVDINGVMVRLNCAGMPAVLNAMFLRMANGLELMQEALAERVAALKTREIKAGSAYRKSRLAKKREARALQIKQLKALQQGIKETVAGAGPGAGQVEVPQAKVDFDTVSKQAEAAGKDMSQTVAGVKGAVAESKKSVGDKIKDWYKDNKHVMEYVVDLGKNAYAMYQKAATLAETIEQVKDDATAETLKGLGEAVKGLGEGFGEWYEINKTFDDKLGDELELDEVKQAAEAAEAGAEDAATLEVPSVADAPAQKSLSQKMEELGGMGQEMQDGAASFTAAPGLGASGLADASAGGPEAELSAALEDLEQKRAELDDAQDQLEDLQQQKKDNDEAMEMLDQLGSLEELS